MERLRVLNDSDYLAHHGVKGQKWGVRKEDDEKELNRVRSLHDEDIRYRKGLNDEQLRLQSKTDKQDQKVANQKRKRVIKNVVFGVALAAIGASVVSRLLKKRFGKQQNASVAIKNNAPTISKGKEYVTGYARVSPRGYNAPKNYANMKSRYIRKGAFTGALAKYSL